MSAMWSHLTGATWARASSGILISAIGVGADGRRRVLGVSSAIHRKPKSTGEPSSTA